MRKLLLFSALLLGALVIFPGCKKITPDYEFATLESISWMDSTLQTAEPNFNHHYVIKTVVSFVDTFAVIYDQLSQKTYRFPEIMTRGTARDSTGALLVTSNSETKFLSFLPSHDKYRLWEMVNDTTFRRSLL